MPKVSPGQLVLTVLWPALVTVEKMLIAPGSLQDSVVAATNSIFAVLVIVFRVPSTAGGTVAPAVQIAPETPVGEPTIAEPKK